MERPELQVHFQLHSEFEASLDNKRVCLKTKKVKERRKEKEI